MRLPLFVYGTLQLGFENRGARALWRAAVRWENGRTLGRVYNLGRYPGMVAARRVPEWVYGQVVFGAAPLAVLDEFEGPEYVRVRQRVRMEAGRWCWAWTYLYRGPLAGKRRIASGRYPLPVNQRQ